MLRPLASILSSLALLGIAYFTLNAYHQQGRIDLPDWMVYSEAEMSEEAVAAAESPVAATPPPIQRRQPVRAPVQSPPQLAKQVDPEPAVPPVVEFDFPAEEPEQEPQQIGLNMKLDFDVPTQTTHWLPPETKAAEKARVTFKGFSPLRVVPPDGILSENQPVIVTLANAPLAQLKIELAQPASDEGESIYLLRIRKAWQPTFRSKSGPLTFRPVTAAVGKLRRAMERQGEIVSQMEASYIAATDYL